jgi:glycosyltransferase involved in cell wall biosynthesis
MSRRSVLFVTPHPVEGPSTRFRIHQFLPALDRAGIDHSVRPFLSSRLAPVAYRRGDLAAKLAVTGWGTFQRLLDVVRARRHDLVYVLREAYPIGPPVFERLLEAASGRIAFDFDDAIYHRYLNDDNPLDRFRDWDRPAKVIARARRTVAGSEILAAYARAHAPSPDHVVVIPTVVDTTVFRPRPRPPDGTIVVGWIGTPRNTPYIQSIWPALARVARSDRRVRYVFVGAEPFDVGDVAVEFRPWTLAGEVADVQRFDIGIMPMPDDAQTRGKCGFKLIEYMACGLPAVASPVGANLQVLADGETGLLAEGEARWAEALLGLVSDASLRGRLGEAGRERAVRAFSLAAMAPRFVETIEQAASGAP